MLILKRLLVIVTTLLCTLSIAACSGPSNANAQAATNSSNSGVSTNAIAKESTQSQSQASKQTTAANKQTTNQTSTNQVTTSVNNSQQVSGQTTVTHNTQSSQQNNSAQNNNQQKTQTTNKKHQTPQTTSSVNDSSTSNGSSNNNGSSGTNTFIKVAQVSVNGQMTNVLTTGNGMTLYYDTNDSSTNATCTGGCAQTWPPLLTQGQVILSNNLTSGQITTQATANGNQVEYNGHPLYTYVNDTAAGQVNGQGVNNVWNAASMVTVQAAHW